MSNQFTRRRYDAEELKTFDSSNNRGNQLLMDRIGWENKESCNNLYNTGHGAGHIARPITEEGFLDFRRKVDIENKVMNRHLELNSNLRNNTDYKEVDVQKMEVCGVEHMVNEDSRFLHPITNYREMSTTHLAFTPYLHMNPQTVHAENERFMKPAGRMGVSSRYDVKKDSFQLTMRDYRTQAEKRQKEGEEVAKKLQTDLKSLLPTRTVHSKFTWWENRADM